MLEDIEVRPSKVPAFLKCPSFCKKPSADSNDAGLPATIGTAVHEIFEKHTTNGEEITPEILKKIASKHNVDIDGYMGLGRKAYKLDEKYREHAMQYFPQPEREKYMSYTMANGYKLKGTADLVQIHADFGVVLDLKTGESEMLDNMPQIKTYALMLWRMTRHLGVSEVYGFVFNPVIDKYQISVWTGRDLEDFETELMDTMDKVGQIYNTGSHCTWCPHLTECPKHLQSCRTLMNGSDMEVATVEDIAEARPKVIWMKQLIKEYEEFEKSVLERAEIIDLGDGTELYMKDRQNKTFDAKKVIKEVYKYREECPTNEVEDAVLGNLKLTSTSIKKIIGSTAGKGMKAKDQAEFMELISEAGAVTESISKVKTVRHVA